jgi:capsular polysaccharide biosynthesis protein
VRDFLLLLWRRVWTVVLVAMVVVGTAIGFTLVQTPMYEASIKILIGQKSESEVPQNLYGDVQGLEQLTLTMVEAVPSRPVAKAVIQRLDLSMTPDTVLKNLKVEQVNTTQFIEVSYRDPDPERAQRIASTVGEVFSEKVSEVSPSANAITATVWEQSPAPEDPVSPDLLRNALAALAVGLILGVGQAFLLEYLGGSWHSSEELEQMTGAPTLGNIPTFKVPKGKKGSNELILVEGQEPGK